MCGEGDYICHCNAGLWFYKSVLPMKSKSSPEHPKLAQSGRRVGLLVLSAVLLVAVALLMDGWITARNDARLLNEAGLEMERKQTLWEIAGKDYHKLLEVSTWKDWWQQKDPSRLRPIYGEEFKRVSKLRNFDLLAGTLKMLNPKRIWISDTSGFYTQIDEHSLPYGCPALENLDGLKGVKSLESLELDNCRSLQNLDGIKGQTSLERIRLTSCQSLKSLEPLRKLSALKELRLGGCGALDSVDGLEGLKSLTDIYIGDTRLVKNWSALSKLDALKRAIFSNLDDMPDMSWAKGLKSFVGLSFFYCHQLKNMEGLDDLDKLNGLSISGCKRLVTLNGLRGLASLEFAYLRDCEALENIEALRGCANLKRLKVVNCPEVSEASIAALKAALPGLSVTVESPEKPATELVPEPSSDPDPPAAGACSP